MDIRGVPRISWGWNDSFRLSRAEAVAPYFFETDCDAELMRVMGYTPPSAPNVGNGDRVTLYDDYTHFTNTIYTWNTANQAYSTKNVDAYRGPFSIGMAHGTGEFRFQFAANKSEPDFKKMRDNNYMLSFTAKADANPAGSYELNVIIYYAGTEKKTKTIRVTADNAWHTYNIPLSNWDGAEWETVSGLGLGSGASGFTNIRYDDIYLAPAPLE